MSWSTGRMARSSVASQKACRKCRTAALAPQEGRVRLEILLDRTSVEVFGNDGLVSLTSCFVPREGEATAHLESEGGRAVVRSLEVWELASAWR
jgi:sucrose-6-phosphate hydrolase SacC (GH32 family)